MTDLTIIVPSLSRLPDSHDTGKMWHAEKECLLSLQETVPEEIQIIIVSNSGDPHALPLSGYFDAERFRRIHLWEQGQCRAVNAAAATVDTKYIMVTNNDMIYPPNWMEKLFVGDMKCFSPVLVEPTDGAPTFIKKPFGGAGGDFRKADFLEFAEGYSDAEIKSGFNLPLVMEKELWDMIGGYDINYDPWGSNGDSDLEYKVRLAGVQPLQVRNCVVYHFSQTSGTFHPSRGGYWGKNFAYFEEKWGFPRTDDGIWEATFKIPYDKLKFRPKWAKLDASKTASGEEDSDNPS